MFNNLRDRMPDMEKSGEAALHWAQDGLQSMRSTVKDGPMLWGAATLGLLAGGLFALWRRGGKSRMAARHKSVAVRNTKKPQRKMAHAAKLNGVKPNGRTGKKPARSRAATQAPAG